MANERLISAMVGLGKFLKRELIRELISQGHRATGSLIKSIEMIIEQRLKAVTLSGEFLFYGEFIDRGRKPGTRKVPVDVLIEWIKQKQFQIDVNKIRGVAFAIQTKIFKEGIPTNKSRSLFQKRTGWLTDTLKDNEKEMFTQIQKGANEEIDILFTNIVRDTNAKLLAA